MKKPIITLTVAAAILISNNTMAAWGDKDSERDYAFYAAYYELLSYANK
jgi:hypothetical protein